MILIFVSAIPQEDRVGDFERAIERIAAAASQLPGCLRYEWYQAPGVERRYITFGEFATRSSFEDYLQSEVVQWIIQELIPLLKTQLMGSNAPGGIMGSAWPVLPLTEPMYTDGNTPGATIITCHMDSAEGRVLYRTFSFT